MEKTKLYIKEHHTKKVSTLVVPIDYFFKHFPRDFFQEMVEKTNIYALQNNNNVKRTYLAEMTSFMGLRIMMGCLGLPRIKMYWNRALNIQIFPNTVSRDRFFELRKNLHFVNNLERPADSTDKLFKVRPFFDSLRRRCLELKREKYLSVDEQIVPFTKRLDIKQYIKNKPYPLGD